jgi:Flp pilus assembly protein TadD
VFDLVVLTLATALAFAPVLRNQFVNWDDPDVIVRNARLGEPGVLAWAFSTSLIGHYQPFAWLIWSATKSLFGLSPAAFHGLSLVGHAAAAVLVCLLMLRLARAGGLTTRAARAAAIAAAFTFALHPLRVEPVAWASAAPYVFSSLPLIASVIAYVDGRLAPSLVFFGLALLTRASAIGLPFVLLLIDLYPLDRLRRTNLSRLAVEKLPFVALAAAAAAAEVWAREAASLSDVPAGARVTMAATAPFTYLAHALLPIRLTPLDALPIEPAIDWLPLAAGIAALLALTAAAWMGRHRWPALLTGWLAFLAMIAPVAGLTPSGVQATADRYMYVPGIVLSVVFGAAVARACASAGSWTTRALPAAGCALALTYGVLTWQQTQYWNNSIALWTRVIDLDPRNDVATYNLAIALAEGGRDDEAISWYERTIALVPEHDLARQNLALLQAVRAERDGNRLAEAGRLDEAADRYARALALDGKRLHSREARGMVLMRLRKFQDAAGDLRQAIDGGSKDPEVANALAFSLVQMGDSAGARAVLKTALADHPDNDNLRRNLERLMSVSR